MKGRGTPRPYVMAAVVMALIGAACSSSSDPSAPYFPKTKPVAVTPAPVDPALSVPTAPLVTAFGDVDRPNPRVTPGAVSVHDVATVCGDPKRLVHPTIPASWDVTIFNSYNIAVKDQGKYRFDYLVPLQLGGAFSISNIWPMTLRAIGFREKQKLNARLRTAVCQGTIPLDQAQHDIVADWYLLFEKYGA